MVGGSVTAAGGGAAACGGAGLAPGAGGGAGIAGAGAGASVGALTDCVGTRLGPQLAFGSVPAMKAMTTGLVHPPPWSRSIGTSTTRSGTGNSSLGVPASAVDMKAVQMGTATREPVSSRPRLRGRS